MPKRKANHPPGRSSKRVATSNSEQQPPQISAASTLSAADLDIIAANNVKAAAAAAAGIAAFLAAKAASAHQPNSTARSTTHVGQGEDEMNEEDKGSQKDKMNGVIDNNDEKEKRGYKPEDEQGEVDEEEGNEPNDEGTSDPAAAFTHQRFQVDNGEDSDDGLSPPPSDLPDEFLAHSPNLTVRASNMAIAAEAAAAGIAAWLASGAKHAHKSDGEEEDEELPDPDEDDQDYAAPAAPSPYRRCLRPTTLAARERKHTPTPSIASSNPDDRVCSTCRGKCPLCNNICPRCDNQPEIQIKFNHLEKKYDALTKNGTTGANMKLKDKNNKLRAKIMKLEMQVEIGRRAAANLDYSRRHIAALKKQLRAARGQDPDSDSDNEILGDDDVDSDGEVDFEPVAPKGDNRAKWLRKPMKKEEDCHPRLTWVDGAID